MALIALTNAVILIGPANLSGDSNDVELSAAAEELDVTTFGTAGYKSLLGGLKTVEIKSTGFWEAGNPGLPDDRLFADLGVPGAVMTVTPTGAAVGDTSYFTRVNRPTYQLGGKVGDVMPFDSTGKGDGTSLVRGQIVDNQARTVTGTSAVATLTAPTATTRVYAAIHVLAVAGTGSPTLTATLQGDNAVGFPSPVTIAAGAPLTAAGGQWIAGPLGVNVDSFFRLSYVISGTSPSFLVIASIGVGA